MLKTIGKLPLTAVEPRFHYCRATQRYCWPSGICNSHLTILETRYLLLDCFTHHYLCHSCSSWLATTGQTRNLWGSQLGESETAFRNTVTSTITFSPFTTFNFLFCHFLNFCITSSKNIQLLNWLHAITTIITSMRRSDIVSNIVQTDKKRKGGEKARQLV